MSKKQQQKAKGVKRSKLSKLYCWRGNRYKGRTPEKRRIFQNQTLFLINKIVLTHRNLSFFEKGTISTVDYFTVVGFLSKPLYKYQPRPQGFSLKKWVKSPGDKVVQI